MKQVTSIGGNPALAFTAPADGIYVFWVALPPSSHLSWANGSPDSGSENNLSTTATACRNIQVFLHDGDTVEFAGPSPSSTADIAGVRLGDELT
jgi:hypothetical protein